MSTKTTADLKRQKLIVEDTAIADRIGPLEVILRKSEAEIEDKEIAKSKAARQSLNEACNKLGAENHALKGAVHAIAKERDFAQEVARYRGAILDVHAFKFHKYSFDNQ